MSFDKSPQPIPTPYFEMIKIFHHHTLLLLTLSITSASTRRNTSEEIAILHYEERDRALFVPSDGVVLLLMVNLKRYIAKKNTYYQIHLKSEQIKNYSLKIQLPLKQHFQAWR